MLIGFQKELLVEVGLGDGFADLVQFEVLELLAELGLSLEDVLDRLLHLGQPRPKLQLSRHAEETVVLCCSGSCVLLVICDNETAPIQIFLRGHLLNELTETAFDARAHLDEPTGLLQVADLAARWVMLLVVLLRKLVILEHLLVEGGRWREHHVLVSAMVLGRVHHLIVHGGRFGQVERGLLVMVIFSEILLHAAPSVDQFLV